VVNRVDPVTLANTINGTGRFIQNGTGTTTLSGTSTYTGSTTINAGVLFVTASISGSAVTVNSGGTLGGTGTTGAVSAVGGASVAPGTNIGTLHTGALSLFSGTTLSLEVGSTTADQVDVTGATLLEGSVNLTITLTADPVDNTTFTVINSTTGVADMRGAPVS
jgi:autotransporter-associated beta strand protein